VAEVDSSLQQLLHGDNRHEINLSWFGYVRPAGSDGTGHRASAPPPGRDHRVGEWTQGW
jgi:hypothetical protein